MMLKRSKVKVNAKRSISAKGKSKDQVVEEIVDAVNQTFIPGTEPISIPDIDRAIAVYMAAHDKLLMAKEDDANAGAKLLELMHTNDLKFYKSKGKMVKVTPGTDKVRVKSVPVPVGA